MSQYQRYYESPVTPRTPVGQPYEASTNWGNFGLRVWVYDKASKELIGFREFPSCSFENIAVYDPIYLMYSWLEEHKHAMAGR